MKAMLTNAKREALQENSHYSYRGMKPAAAAM